jgi:hypothetical protein
MTVFPRGLDVVVVDHGGAVLCQSPVMLLGAGELFRSGGHVWRVVQRLPEGMLVERVTP